MGQCWVNLKAMNQLTWVEISKEALKHNIRQFRGLVGSNHVLAPCIKANAYGHGLIECGRIFLEAGADWLAVNALYEAIKLREAGIESPIYILGYVPLDDLELATDFRLIVYNLETIERLGQIGKPVKVHIKVETGSNRQGVMIDDLLNYARYIGEFENIEIEGLTTHFANVEDTTDHSYAEGQLGKFSQAVEMLSAVGVDVPIKHCANSAATILFPKTHFQMVRTGIANYGMWPSNETYVSFLKERDGGFELKPAFNWKTKVAQIKTIPAGEYIGYGCTYRTTHETRLAILPIGYYDGYDRGVHGGHVLIKGKRAPIRGRICMNIMMVDVTHIEDAQIEDEVVLIGSQGDEKISAEDFAGWAGTINYEVTTRVNERIPRILV